MNVNPDKWLASQAEAFTVANDFQSRVLAMIEECAESRDLTEYKLGGYEYEHDWFALAYEVIAEMKRNPGLMRIDTDNDEFLKRIGWLMVKSVNQRLLDLVEFLDAPDEQEEF